MSIKYLFVLSLENLLMFDNCKIYIGLTLCKKE